MLRAPAEPPTLPPFAISGGREGQRPPEERQNQPSKYAGPWPFPSFFNSKLPYDVTPEQALSHEEVKTRLDTSIKNMRTVTDKFLLAIISSVEKIP